MTSHGERTPLQRAAIALKEMRARLDAAERAAREPIAIVGMACRYPGGANDPERYWRLLADGVCATAKVPADRWDADAYYDADPDAIWKMYTREGCFIDQPIDAFDAGFFGVSPREAAMLDPQQRLLLELAWEALEDAGVAPDRLAGSSTGVYVGLITGDYGRVRFQDLPQQDLPYMGTGNDMSFAGGRISYVLGLQGPCMVIATACSSTLVTTHLACQALRARECDLALSGGASLMIYPDNNIVLSKMRATAPDGRCKTFDASADGFGRGEGSGMLVLKRLADARRDGDRVLALVRGSAVNHDGQSGGITVPNGPAQERLLRQALAAGGLEPSELDYLEAHGTGTPLGDPIEALAIEAVFGAGRPADRPLRVGSVKTNIGHLEAAAGVAGIMKVVLALAHEQLPAHLHFTTPNPRIPWERMHLEVPRAATPWPAGERRRLAGISSFGLSGVNAHVILEEPPAEPPAEPAPAGAPAGSHLLAISGKTPEAVRELARRYAARLRRPDGRALPAICATAAAGRAQLPHRLAVVGADPDELAGALEDFAAGRAPAGRPAASGQVSPIPRKRLAFLFTGQGAQYAGMGRELHATEPCFAEALERCEAALRAAGGPSVVALLYGPAATDGELEQTAHTQPALVAIEIALTELWRSWGITPAFVLGHSIGELSAAYAAGALSLEDAITLAAARGRVMQALPGGGAMVGVHAERALVEEAIAPELREVAIAASNGPRDLVVSGAGPAVARVVARLEARGVAARPLRVSHAFHSPLMEPALRELAAVVEQVSFAPPRIPLISNVTGLPVAAGELTPAYFAHHARHEVKFAQGVQTLARLGADVFVELGPRPTLLALAQASLGGGGDGPAQAAWLPSLRRGAADREQMRASAAELWVRGLPIDPAAVEPRGGGRKVALPTYPFQRKRYWMTISPGAGHAAPSAAAHPLLGARLRSAARTVVFESSLAADRPEFLADHRVYDAVVVPGAAYAEMALAAAAELFGDHPGELADVHFHRALRLHDGETRTVQLVATPSGDDGAGFAFELSSLEPGGGWTLHAAGSLRRTAAAAGAGAIHDLAAIHARCGQEISVAEFYRRVGERGIEYGPAFRAVDRFWRGPSEALGVLKLPASLEGEAARYRLHPVLLDACFQVLGAAFPDGGPEHVYLPVSLERLRLHRPLPAAPRVAVRLAALDPGARVQRAELQLLDEDGALVGEVEGLRFQQAPREALLGNLERVPRTWLYQPSWRPAPLAPRAGRAEAAAAGAAAGRWLILADEGGEGHRLAARLRAGGRGCLVVRAAGVAREAAAAGELVVDPARPAELRTLVEQAGPLAGAVVLWGLDAAPASELTPELLERDALRACAGALHLAQALLAVAPARLWIVTRGAVPVTDGAGVPGLAQAPLVGLGQAIAIEHPALRCTRIDLDPDAADSAELLAAELDGESPEDRICHRGGARHVARLARAPGALDAPPIELRPDAAYLVTGGLGGLGLAAARWLAERGARHLVLVGRSAPGAAAAAAIRELEQGGARVTCGRADVGRAGELAAVLAGLERPLAGVLHAAGVLDDRMLTGVDLENLARVAAPKVTGAWQLHELTRAHALDFFAVFSSAASLLGHPGQASYTAANTFLDALAHHRRSLGLCGLSINWGAWSEIGAASAASVRERVLRLGGAMIAPRLGLDALGRLLARAPAQVGVLPIHWGRLELEVAAPFFEDLTLGRASAPGAGFRPGYDAAAPGERRKLLVQHLRLGVARVLGLAAGQAIDDEQGFFEAGMDSMMATELRNLLERTLACRLPATVAFDHPSVAALAEHLTSEVLAPPPAAPAVEAPADPEVAALLHELGDMSEADAARALAPRPPADARSGGGR